ncbi:MAG: 4Fe-4S dicluster domain-containing protein [Deltaproteobacteria bacterium]|nr:4Fe-4S dicluster domain-containing protein [Deltaproteobacteria bacterium]
MTKKGLSSFVDNILKDFKVYGPVKKDGFSVYEKISASKELNLLHIPSHLSPKKYLLPHKETLLRFRLGEEHEAEQDIFAEEQILFGIHPCDIHAIKLTDRVFAYGTPDANYLKRREKTIIIGSECMPDKFCFCKSVNTSNIESGFDLFLHEIKRGYLIRIGTDKGKELLLKYTKIRKATLKEISKLADFKNKKEQSFSIKLDIDPSHLPLLYAGSYNSPIWERIGNICYGCGSCNLVCPTCYCFDVRDEVSSNLKSGERYRVWDGCLLEDFAKVSGGHNFRKTKAERLRHRFNRKSQYQADKFGGLFCVGCGRCSRACLVNINIAEITNELVKEQEGDRKS